MTISIITVTFNSENTLACTIESVLRQQYEDYEYLVVDGGSTDSTLDIIKEWAPKFNGKLRWISEKDKGMYDGINKGIRMATGDVVGIINSDDFYHRNDIFNIISDTFTHNPGIEAIYGDVRFVKPNNLERTVRYYSSKAWHPWKFRFGYMPAHPSFFTYRSNFDKYGYYKDDYYISGDFELMIRHLYINSVPTIYIPVDFLKMRTGGRSTNGIKSIFISNKEDVRACKENGIWTCMPLLILKYFVKVFELVNTNNYKYSDGGVSVK